MVTGLAPVGPGGQEELLPRGAPVGPCAATAPSTQLLPGLGDRGHPKLWVLGVLTKLHSQSLPGQQCGARGCAAPRQGPCSPAPTPFPPVPAGAGRGPELPGIQCLVPAPENIAAGPGPNPAMRNLPSRPGVAPGSGWTDARTRRSDHSQGQQQWGWWEIQFGGPWLGGKTQHGWLHKPPSHCDPKESTKPSAKMCAHPDRPGSTGTVPQETPPKKAAPQCDSPG